MGVGLVQAGFRIGIASWKRVGLGLVQGLLRVRLVFVWVVFFGFCIGLLQCGFRVGLGREFICGLRSV